MNPYQRQQEEQRKQQEYQRREQQRREAQEYRRQSDDRHRKEYERREAERARAQREKKEREREQSEKFWKDFNKGTQSAQRNYESNQWSDQGSDPRYYNNNEEYHQELPDLSGCLNALGSLLKFGFILSFILSTIWGSIFLIQNIRQRIAVQNSIEHIQEAISEVRSGDPFLALFALDIDIFMEQFGVEYWPPFNIYGFCRLSRSIVNNDECQMWIDLQDRILNAFSGYDFQVYFLGIGPSPTTRIELVDYDPDGIIAVGITENSSGTVTLPTNPSIIPMYQNKENPSVFSAMILDADGNPFSIRITDMGFGRKGIGRKGLAAVGQIDPDNSVSNQPIVVQFTDIRP